MNSDFKELLDALNAAEVKYLVVGGYMGREDLIAAKKIAGRPEDAVDIRNLTMLDE